MFDIKQLCNTTDAFRPAIQAKNVAEYIANTEGCKDKNSITFKSVENLSIIIVMTLLDPKYLREFIIF